MVGLARRVAEIVAANDAGLMLRIEEEARDILRVAARRKMTSPSTANLVLRKIRWLSGVKDPFAGLKAQEMAVARKAYERAYPHIVDGLRSRVTAAALGNSLDFFREAESALADLPARIKAGLHFYQDDISLLEQVLPEKPELVLYLADNAGEIYFDRPLYDYVAARSERTVLVVKGGPALNDLTREDLETYDLEGCFQEVADTGTDGAGIDWERVSPEFRDLVSRADLILAKGMANYETIPVGPITVPVFFLFRVKCEPIRTHLDAPAESFWALWHEGQYSRG